MHKKASVEMLSSAGFKKRIEEEDATMLKYLGILKQINALGFLTNESQAGKKSKGVSPISGKAYEMNERAYITGFMLEEEAQKFIKNMGIYTDKNAVYVPFCSNDVKLPSALDIPLTITKIDGKIQVETHTSLTLPESVGNFFRKEMKLSKTEKVVFVTCWDPKWNRLASGKKGLFTEVAKVLKMSA